MTALATRPAEYYDAIHKYLVDSNKQDDADMKELIKWALLRTKTYGQANATDDNNEEAASKRPNSLSVILVPQLLAKFHPRFDHVIRQIMTNLPYSILVMVHNSNKKQAWKRTLIQRWRRSLGGKALQRVVWFNSLTPEQYLALLAIGDIMLGL
jgi:hypothetical protein